VQRIDRQADLGLFAGADAVADRAAQPVDAAEGRRHAKEVALGHAGRVVPEEEADARLEAEVEERGGHEARAALLEREEVDEERGPVLSLGRGEQPAEGLTDQVLEDEVDREEEDPREPEHDLARGGPGLVAAVVVGQLAPRDGGLLGLGLRVGLVRVAVGLVRLLGCDLGCALLFGLRLGLGLDADGDLVIRGVGVVTRGRLGRGLVLRSRVLRSRILRSRVLRSDR